MVSQLLDVVHQAVELPLPIDLGAPAQCEAMEPLVVSEVAEDRLDSGKARGNHALAGVGVDPPFHSLGVALFAVAFALKEGDLTRLSFVGGAQALVAQRTRNTVALGAAKLHRRVTVEG